MAVISGLFSLGMQDAVCGTVKWNQGPLGAVLLTGYTFDQDNHHFLKDCMGFEIAQGGANSGYTSLGATVGNGTISYDSASNEVRIDFADPTWTTATFSASSMVVYWRSAGGTTTSWPMIQYVEFGSTQTVSSGTFSYQVPATGSAAITMSTQQ